MFGELGGKLPQVLDFASKRVRNIASLISQLGVLPPTNGGIVAVAAGGTADALTVSFTPAIVPFDGMMMALVLTAANATTTPTISTNGGAARTITKKGGSAVAAGDLPGALSVGLFEYNLANTRWELLNPAATASRVTSVAEVTDSTDITLAIAPSQTNIGSAVALTIPTKGFISINFSGEIIIAGGTFLILGIRIGSTNYWPTSTGSSTQYLNTVAPTGAVTLIYNGLGSDSANLTNGGGPQITGLNIEAAGVPTGAQTVQLIGAKTTANAMTLKGTVIPTRILINVEDHT